MKFYGNGIVRLSSSGSLRFSKPAIRYEKGVYETDDPKIIAQLIRLGYENDGNRPNMQPEPLNMPDSDRMPEQEQPSEQPEPDEAPAKSQRDILAEQAESLGIQVKGNWGVKKLTSEIQRVEGIKDDENS